MCVCVCVCVCVCCVYHVPYGELTMKFMLDASSAYRLANNITVIYMLLQVVC